ncbi:formimidoylglutamase [Flavobacteriaceae bacterium]|nr:formimidoylglutamase [Flavobacteriaceae bacterium]
MNRINKVETVKLLSPRNGEIKAGEKLATSIDQAEFVIFGIEEDLGVQANFGFPGAKNNWIPFLKAFLNTQYNRYNTLEKVYVLGSLSFNEGESIEQIDGEISQLTESISGQGKIPIAIGGGHNNAYGMIKGCSAAQKTSINVLNFDAHTDFRQLETRHSGNGFSYAYNEGYLDKYCVYGVHENYTPEYILKTFEEDDNLKLITMENLIDHSQQQESYLNQSISFLKDKQTGLEVDLDCISHLNSSAMTPSGFEFIEFRKMFRSVVQDQNPIYLHLCEGISDKTLPDYQKNQVAKVLAYLVTDFIKMFKSDQKE